MDAPGATGGEGGSGPVTPEALGAFSVPRLIAELSDPAADDIEPTLTEDELEMHFCSTRLDGFRQIFVTTRATKRDRWGAPKLVQEIASVMTNSYSPELSDRGLSLWFVSNRPGAMGADDVFVTHRSDRGAPWSLPENVPSLSTGGADIDPGPLPEYDQFMTTRVDPFGHNHLFLARRSGTDAAWDEPIYQTQLNSSQKEGDPAFARDGLVLYLATTRDSPNQDNRADIWRATRSSRDSDFGAPAPVRELNILEVDDQDPWVSNDERHIVFTSARDGWPRDIYEAFR